MDDLKAYAVNDEQLKKLLDIVKTFSDDINIVRAVSWTIAQIGTKVWNLAQRLIIGSTLKILRETRPESHVTADISIFIFGNFFRQNAITCISFERKFYAL